MTEIPRPVSKLDQQQIQQDLRKFQDMGTGLGASDACIIRAECLVVQERIRGKCSIPKCAEYGTNLHCPPYSPTAQETKDILKDYSYGVAVKIDINPEYTAGAEIQKCYLRGEIDKTGRYRTLGKQYNSSFAPLNWRRGAYSLCQYVEIGGTFLLNFEKLEDF